MATVMLISIRVGVHSTTSPQVPGIKPGMIRPIPLLLQVATNRMMQAKASYLKSFLKA